LVSDDALEAAVLLLQLPQSLRLARLHAAVLPLPAVERGRGDAMLTTQIIDRGAGVCLAENSYDLLVCEPALPHPVLLSRTDIIAGSGSGEHFMPWLLHLPEAQQWGSLTFGGPLITASGLVFIAAGQDDRIRAFDIHNGELLWEHELPAGGQAAPMTFVKDGRQFVILSAGGRAGVGSPGDWIVAFALPQR